MTNTPERPAVDGPPPGPPPGRRRRSAAWRWVGRLLITAGVVVGLYGVYELFITDVIAESERTEIAEQWRAGIVGGQREQRAEVVGGQAGDREPAAPQIGTEHRDDFPVIEIEGEGTVGMLHVPRWDEGGEAYAVPIGAGTGDEVLDTGQLGHYSGTQPIGARGNAGLSGHRTTHGKPLREVHHLVDGDALVVESEDAWLVYRVVARDIVKPHQSEVLDPIPPFEGAAEGRYLTLTTCDPIFGITDRYIIWAEADYWTPKSEGLVPALA